MSSWVNFGIGYNKYYQTLLVEAGRCTVLQHWCEWYKIFPIVLRGCGAVGLRMRF